MNTKGHYYLKSIILQAVYFKLRFTSSSRDVEIMKMRGVNVDHSTIQSWVYKFTALMEMKNEETQSTRWR